MQTIIRLGRMTIQTLSILLKGIKRFSTAICLAALLTLNVLTLTSTVVSGAAQSVMAGIGITTVLASNAATAVGTMAVSKAKLTSTSKRVRGRAIARISRSVGSLALEGLPFIGAAAAIGGLSYEVNSQCEDILDMYILQESMGIEPEPIPELCNIVL